jgi:lambda family phage minor tail protein L
MADIKSEVVKLNPSAIIELFQLQMPPEAGGDTYYFHNGVNMFKNSVVWQGVTYLMFPIEAEGFSLTGRGEIPRPKLKVANLTNFIRGLVIDFDDLIGAKVTRIRTFSRFLDAVNFTDGNTSADPTRELSKDEYYIDRKTNESKSVLEFELASPWDLENIKLPRRQIFANLCAWKYRGIECGVVGTPKADITDSTTAFSGPLVDRGEWNIANTYAVGDYCYITSQNVKYYFVCYGGAIGAGIENRPPSNSNWVADQCSKKLSGCKLRYGTNGVLPIGIMPGTSRLPLGE